MAPAWITLQWSGSEKSIIPEPLVNILQPILLLTLEQSIETLRVPLETSEPQTKSAY